MVVAQELSQARDLPTIVALVQAVARELTLADGATVVLRDGDACYCAEEDAIAPRRKGRRVALEDCVSGWSMLHREAVVIEDLDDDPRTRGDAHRPPLVTSLAMVPIRRSDPVGAIGSYWATRYRPPETAVRLLQALAELTASAVANVELLAHLEHGAAERTEQLEAVNRELEAFSYAVSHDLRAPLRAIKGFSQILIEDHAAALDDGKLYLDRISGAASRMNDLIDDLLQLSKMTRSALHPGAFDLAQVSRDIVGELGKANPGRQVDVVIPEALPARGDPRLVRVLLENLLGNAWKFTSKQPTAHIEVGSQDGAWFVRDDGAGFDAARATKLFEPFQRMHTAAEFEGTGIGLATAQRIVRRHGGRIWADSAPGKGATFRFTLGPVIESRHLTGLAR